ncbi:hypothetical protein [Streptomyces peucetius]|uniref:N-acetyltransferase n=1 Tax=Streptomyces peucetius TaxID=1950 RepID=A0ABY6HZX7_STRPE|nr:hypothetical protein [Streptomyces peucetius]UYQ60069.1 hypothetical protein OGH68_00230 [Streptomyces peucetius]
MSIGARDVIIRECDPARRADVAQFLDAGRNVHAHCHTDSSWVAPLDTEMRRYLSPKNPLFRHVDVALWTAVWKGLVVGSIAAIDDNSWQPHQRPDGGGFGFFECVDSVAVAHALMDTASEWLRARGRRHVIGPFNLTTNYSTGLLADNFDSVPSLMMPYNPPYYLELMRACGLTRVKELWEWEMPLDGRVPTRLARVADRVARETGVAVRDGNPRLWASELSAIRDIYNTSWRDNWGFVPYFPDEFAYVADGLKPLLKHSVIVLAENANGPVGFLLALPDLNPRLRPLNGTLLSRHTPRLAWSMQTGRGIESCRVALMGVVPEARRTGIAALMLAHAFQSPAAAHWKRATMGWTDPSNVDISRVIQATGATQCRSFRVFGTDLDSA